MVKKVNEDSLCGNLTDLPNEKYKKLFATFDEIEIIDVSQWRPVHILGYFCKKYKDTYSVPYKFKFNNPSPQKCFEIFQVKRLAMLLSSKPNILKEYIDWVYDTKVIKAKRRLTSISFMTVDGIVNEYKTNILLVSKNNLNIDRSVPFPDKFKEPFKAIGVSISNYGDLAFLYQMEQTPEMSTAFNKLLELGFDKDILEKIV